LNVTNRISLVQFSYYYYYIVNIGYDKYSIKDEF
jgi:hypothetical protein